MALNYVWIAFFLIAFCAALVKLIFFQDYEIFQKIVTGTFDSAKTGAEISIGLIGLMTFWLGIMKIGEKGGMIQIFARAVGPFFAKLFPEIPRNHPAYGSILMNFSANMLGLDNAATPLGLKAMKELQELNPNKETASNVPGIECIQPNPVANLHYGLPKRSRCFGPFGCFYSDITCHFFQYHDRACGNRTVSAHKPLEQGGNDLSR
jgi:Nucleoside recognition